MFSYYRNNKKRTIKKESTLLHWIEAGKRNPEGLQEKGKKGEKKRKEKRRKEKEREEKRGKERETTPL